MPPPIVYRICRIDNESSRRCARWTRQDFCRSRYTVLGRRIRATLKDSPPLAVAQQVTVGIRPEYVRMTDRTGENAIPGTVVQAVEGIAAIAYRFHVQGDTPAGYDLEASLSKADAHTIPGGRTSYLYLPPERLYVIRD